MALIFCDSFDHYATADILQKWTTHRDPNNTVNITAAAGRNSTSGLVISGYPDQEGIAVGFTGGTSIIVGFAAKVVGGARYQWGFLSPTGHSPLHFGVSNVGALNVVTGSATYAGAWGAGITGEASIGSVADAIPTNQWCYVEIYATFTSSATGVVTVRVNGEEVIALTGVTTVPNGIASCSGFFLTRHDAGTDYYDDFYVCNLTGGVNDTFLGDVRIDCHYPTADSIVSWTPSTGSNYACVDETALSTTDYVSTTTVGNSDSYTVQDLVNTGETILGVQLNLSVKKTSSGAVNVVGTVHGSDSAAITLTSDAAVRTAIWDVDPATGTTWTESDFNASTFGIKKV